MSKTMTFKTRCKKFVNNTPQMVQRSCVLQDYELCSSFNFNTNIDESTKVVIVGTLTPYRGRQNGFFYSSPTNRMFEILDAYLSQINKPSNLLELKKQLINNPKNCNIIDKLKAELSKNNIALLDVINSAVASKITASDDEIVYFDLDYDAFARLKDKNIVFVCNSRNAECALQIISKHNNQDMKIDFAPQIWRKSKQAIQEKWNEVLNKYLLDVD